MNPEENIGEELRLLQYNYGLLKLEVEKAEETHAQLLYAYIKEVASVSALRSAIIKIAVKTGENEAAFVSELTRVEKIQCGELLQTLGKKHPQLVAKLVEPEVDIPDQES